MKQINRTLELPDNEEVARKQKEGLYRELLKLDYEKCDRYLYNYFQSSWEIIEPATELLPNWHQGLITEYLTACYEREIKRLVINIPPRYAKSNLVSVCFPTWVWGKKPETRFIYTSYSYDLSLKHSGDRSSLIRSRWYQSRWGGEYQVRKDSGKFITNSKRGHMIATSLRGTGTGFGGDFVIADDPHDARKVFSDTIRDSDVEAFRTKFTTRLDDKINGVIIIIMQRLHENDIAGYCLSEGGGYEHLKIPVIAPEKTTIIFPKSNRKVVREEGDILHPARQSKEILDTEKNAMGTYNFSGQYQQEPSPREGGIFKRAYWKRYIDPPDIITFDYVFDSWDCSFKELQDSSFVAGGVWGVMGAFKYLLHVKKERMGFIKTIAAIERNRELFPKITRSVIEDKANGTAVIEVLQSKIPGIIAFNPGSNSKIERAYAVEPQFEAGNIWIPVKEKAGWVDDYIEEMSKFPNAINNDQVDMTTQALLYVSSHPGAGAFTLTHDISPQ